MKNRTLTFLLIALAVVIVLIFVADFISTRPDKQETNPYAYDVESQKVVDEALILYRETRNLKLPMENPTSIGYAGGALTVSGDRRLIRLDTYGKLLKEIPLDFEPFTFLETAGSFYVSGGNSVAILDTAGVRTGSFATLDTASFITSLDAADGKIFAADAGRRVVCRYAPDGSKELEFEGKTGEGTSHGFIVPSPFFSLAVSPFGDLWVVNPGKHALEEYTYDGALRGFWAASFPGIEGFGGCCNPARIAFLPDGNLITSEKGLLRVKVYKPSGELVGVVAPPSKFVEDQKVPDITSDEKGRIYILDPEKRMIRVFEKK
ncbi:MAG: hypothetical protein KA780_02180 [Prolixibacteraceae bacterium]|nr:hypothetical protein [Prolixibacteraceae bacterium]